MNGDSDARAPLVVVTRERGRNDSLRGAFEAAGCDVVELPLTRTVIEDEQIANVRLQLGRLRGGAWVVITSPNGARALAQAMGTGDIGGVRRTWRLAVIGPGTATAFVDAVKAIVSGDAATAHADGLRIAPASAEALWEIDLVSPQPTAVGTAEAVVARLDAQRSNKAASDTAQQAPPVVMMVVGDLAPTAAQELVGLAGYEARRVEAYRTAAVDPAETDLVALAAAADGLVGLSPPRAMVVVCAPSAAASWVAASASNAALASLEIAAIGPTSARRLRDLERSASVVGRGTSASLIDAVLAHLHS